MIKFTEKEANLINSALGYQMSIAPSKLVREELSVVIEKLNYILDNDSTIS
ncbi:MAG: hypothetical protein ACRC1M_08560 [Methanobacteriaceae archaeon]